MTSSNEISFFPDEEVSRIIEERALLARAKKSSGPPSGLGKLAAPIVQIGNAKWTWPSVVALLIVVGGFVAWLIYGK